MDISKNSVSVQAVRQMHPYEFNQAIACYFDLAVNDDDAVNAIVQKSLPPAGTGEQQSLRRVVDYFNGDFDIAGDFCARLQAMNELLRATKPSEACQQRDQKAVAMMAKMGVKPANTRSTAIMALAALEPLEQNGCFDTQAVMQKFDQFLDTFNALDEVPSLSNLLYYCLREHRNDLRDLMNRDEFRRYYGENDIGPVGICLAFTLVGWNGLDDMEDHGDIKAATAVH